MHVEWKYTKRERMKGIESEKEKEREGEGKKESIYYTFTCSWCCPFLSSALCSCFGLPHNKRCVYNSFWNSCTAAEHKQKKRTHQRICLSAGIDKITIVARKFIKITHTHWVRIGGCIQHVFNTGIYSFCMHHTLSSSLYEEHLASSCGWRAKRDKERITITHCT